MYLLMYSLQLRTPVILFVVHTTKRWKDKYFTRLAKINKDDCFAYNSEKYWDYDQEKTF